MPRGTAETDSLIDSGVYQQLRVYAKNMLLGALQEKKVLEEFQRELEDDEMQLRQRLADLEAREKGQQEQ